MGRFITYITEGSAYDTDSVKCMSEREYIECIELDHGDWAEWVWQYAVDKKSAIAQHFEKHDAWQENPEKDTY